MTEKLNIIGDIYLPKKYDIDFELENVVCNLEFPLSTRGTPARNKVNLGVDIPFLLETFESWPLAMNLANNHIMDYGQEGYSATIRYLEKQGVKYFGAGNPKNNFNNPCRINIGEKLISLFGYSCLTTHPVFGGKCRSGSARLDVDKVIKDIKDHKGSSDLIIIQLHWGNEEIPFPTFHDTIIARRLIDNGADMVVGHHSHVIQSFEVYKGKYIFYGLGNFIFPDLDVPSYFDGKKFLSRYRKKQSKKNKESLIIEYNVEKNTLVKHATSFDDKIVSKKKKVYLPKFIPSSEQQYLSRLRAYKRLLMLKKFVSSPRMPNISQLRRFIELE